MMKAFGSKTECESATSKGVIEGTRAIAMSLWVPRSRVGL
jgi:hypothetical protein